MVDRWPPSIQWQAPYIDYQIGIELLLAITSNGGFCKTMDEHHLERQFYLGTHSQYLGDRFRYRNVHLRAQVFSNYDCDVRFHTEQWFCNIQSKSAAKLCIVKDVSVDLRFYENCAKESHSRGLANALLCPIVRAATGMQKDMGTVNDLDIIWLQKQSCISSLN